MIPTYQAFMQPLLKLAKSKAEQTEIKFRDAVNQLISEFGLSEADCTETLPSGQQSMVDNRIGWAKTYLVKAGLLEATRRAHFKITPRGCEALKDAKATHVTIDSDYLKQFDEFIAFKLKVNDAVFVAEKRDPAMESASVKGASSTKLVSIPAPTSISITDNDMTPDEALSAAYQKINATLAEDILARTRKVTPAFFEQLLIDLLLAMGYGGAGDGAAHAFAQVLGQSGDNGIDGVIDQDPLGVDQIYIQAKRYGEGNNVGAGDIRDFFGALNLKKAQKGIFITTSNFTASARQTAKALGMRIVLINGTELAKLMLRYNIGSRDRQVLHLKQIDEDFFEQ
ncbi:restriction endonuclease [uncultured Shewanella sp.]|uniref:restriction endonuclease n=1 Tax=uncultured Shewanella sp. TaxID=173975 RepID=UPI0026216B37|nr:restriction endonuclease [uncultured Shewanella sp.]